MKLRNKKTGEIIRFYDGITLNGEDYDSLAELNEEWEDCPQKRATTIGSEKMDGLPDYITTKAACRCPYCKRIVPLEIFITKDKKIATAEIDCYELESIELKKELKQLMGCKDKRKS